MLSQELCKARIRSFLVTGMTLANYLPIKPQTCFIISRFGGLGWPLDNGYVLLLQPCDSSTSRVGRSIVMLKHEWVISVAQFVFYRIKVYWQCSDIIVRIHVSIENDLIASTVVTHDPHTIRETIRFIFTMRRHAGIYFSRLFSILASSVTICKIKPRFNGENKQDQLSGIVQLRVMVHYRCRRSRFLRPMSVFLYTNTAVDCMTWPWSILLKVRLETACSKCHTRVWQWAKSDALYKPSEGELIPGCVLLWTTTTCQSLLSTSFPIPLSNPPYGINLTIEPIGNILGSSTS